MTRRELAGPVVRGVRCLRWVRAIQSQGYGSFSVGKGKTVQAHRWLFERLVGPLAPGYVPDHLCRNHWCAEVLHLEAVTGKENTLRGVSPPAMNARKRDCFRGHPLSGSNLYIKPDGKRQCRACRVVRGECIAHAGRPGQRRARPGCHACSLLRTACAEHRRRR